MVWVLTIPVAAVTLVLAPELTALLFINAHWGEADFTFCAQTALAARVIALAFSFIAIENILMPGLFSIQSMWWPTIWGLVATVFQLLCLLGLARANLGRDSAVLVAGVAMVYPLSRVFKNAILMLVLRHKTQAFAGPRFWILLLRMTGLTAGGFLLMYVCHKACGRVLGDIPTDADVVVYKVKLVLQIGVPAALMLAGFTGLLLLCGYRQRLMELIASLRHRGKGRGNDAPRPVMTE
jgi:peptidoglycan biosynthesis protein MviN/MurJ (putative lipid II flippase)